LQISPQFFNILILLKSWMISLRSGPIISNSKKKIHTLMYDFALFFGLDGRKLLG